MPGKKDGVEMDEECLVDVYGLEVVEEASCPWGGRKGQRRLSAETHEGGYVSFSVARREASPVAS